MPIIKCDGCGERFAIAEDYAQAGRAARSFACPYCGYSYPPGFRLRLRGTIGGGVNLSGQVEVKGHVIGGDAIQIQIGEE